MLLVTQMLPTVLFVIQTLTLIDTFSFLFFYPKQDYTFNYLFD